MPKRVVSVSRAPGQMTLDLVSHGRRGPAGTLGLSLEQVAQVARTVRRTPEVIVKVSGGGRDSAGAQAHFDYIDRHGKLDVETDDGRKLQEKGTGADLVDEWNLALSEGQYRRPSTESGKDTRRKVVHNIVLSMPAPTPPEAVLAAARVFAREHFALQYRYAMVLHTDQRHPHVHLVVKAEHEFEPGKRLHIRKATLRQWREEFAKCMRAQGVAANATPGAIRGRLNVRKKDPIHQRMRAVEAYEGLSAEEKSRRSPPKESLFMRSKVSGVLRELANGGLAGEPGKGRLVASREQVLQQWAENADALRLHGEESLARQVLDFVRTLPAVRTENEQIAAGLAAQFETAAHWRQSDVDRDDRKR